LADVFQEVDEDLRRDHYQKLWQKYGKYLVALAVVVIGATAATVGWRDYNLRQRQAEGARLAAAVDLARAGDHKAASDAFAALGRDGAAGYAVLARLHGAGALMAAGDRDGALAAYDTLAADGKLDALLRDLARLLAVMHRLDTGEPAALLAQLQPIATDTNPWRHNAFELSALIALRQNDTARARDMLRRLADDAAAPNAARARASELLTGLGS
jgi:hypothetical protein